MWFDLSQYVGACKEDRKSDGCGGAFEWEVQFGKAEHRITLWRFVWFVSFATLQRQIAFVLQR